MYVLKANIGGPEFYLEYVYDDTVEVHNGIALTERESTKDMLLHQDFDLIGEIEDKCELPKLLGLNNVEQPVTVVHNEPVKQPELAVEPQLVPLSKITKFTPDSPKSWALNK